MAPQPAIHPETASLLELRAKLAEKPPFCSGIFALPPEQLQLYYGKQDHKFIDFSTAVDNPDIVAELAAACQPAKFGRNNETVLDETYRKAGKMDREDFLMRFDATESGLLRVVHATLLASVKEMHSIRAELYKLNVYGEGEFFKAHADTPLGTNMVGSLVLCLPTAHEGGALFLRHGGKEWMFDANALLGGRTDALAYVAFFSDVEHEVAPVLSGHRVTVTYNLFWTSEVPSPLQPQGVTVDAPVLANPNAIADSFDALLADRAFMPKGGIIGFGLRHKYPFPRAWKAVKGAPDPLERLSGWLKGGDAALKLAVEGVGLKPHLRYVVHSTSRRILLKQMVVLPTDCVQEEPLEVQFTWRNYGGQLIKEAFFGAAPAPAPKCPPGEAGFYGGGFMDTYCDEDEDEEEEEEGYRRKDAASSIEIHWITPTEAWNGTSAPFLAYGNQASLDYWYASVCILVKIGPADDRGVRPRAVVERPPKPVRPVQAKASEPMPVPAQPAAGSSSDEPTESSGAGSAPAKGQAKAKGKATKTKTKAAPAQPAKAPPAKAGKTRAPAAEPAQTMEPERRSTRERRAVQRG
ncbi:uncharacterized protein BXZ73DRAFT_50793 [Epithele typhae]|uniref:uncharacterized protein n=1 Tax=Epithele typhae TaxID=378194 RepID=UPI002007EE4B|nr:uncharacterized protein BXZ73DRAFT_50793 [Epithele typhae]KAH9923766.1 hypothetical protein BXZ73DRAFT_50793 [Epithele typhae]